MLDLCIFLSKDNEFIISFNFKETNDKKLFLNHFLTSNDNNTVAVCRFLVLIHCLQFSY